MKKAIFIFLGSGLLVAFGWIYLDGRSQGNWKEQVKLLDGRVITIAQWRKYESAFAGSGSTSSIVRDAKITMSMPETGSPVAVWHEALLPMRLDVIQGAPFIVAYPPTWLEWNRYGRPIPAYVAFTYQGEQWRRVPFEAIPKEIYSTNLVIARALPDDLELLTLEQKNSPKFNGDSGIYKGFKVIQQNFGAAWKGN